MKITRKNIIEYRKLQKQSWHDQEWHNKMDSPKMSAINYAIDYLATDRNADHSYTAIAREAEKFLEYEGK